MTMNILVLLQVTISLFLIAAVILQSRGHQGGVAFGTYGQTYRSKKGLEKLLFYLTIALAALFASISILAVLI